MFMSCEVLAAWWHDLVPASAEEADGEPAQLGLDLAHAQELLAATGKARCRPAVPALIRALADVRARPYVAEALGRIGDDRARAPLKALLATEPYVTTRPYEARALLALGVKDWGTAGDPSPGARATLRVPAGAVRILALVTDPGAALGGTVVGRAAGAEGGEGPVRALPVPPQHGRTLEVNLHVAPGGIVALWVVPAAALD